jgi:diguanylate cyclase (GGDEF)-like protein
MLAATFDFKTLLLVYVAIHFIQAGGLVFVYHINRRYAPARLWAIGSSLIAAGALLVALRGTASDTLSILVGNGLLMIGVNVFYMGVIQIRDGTAPWRFGWSMVATGLAGYLWFTLVAPSVAARTVIFTIVLVSLICLAGVNVWRGGTGDGSQHAGVRRFLAISLLADAALLIIRVYGMWAIGSADTLASNGYQAVFVLGLICTAVMVMLGLTFITTLMVSDRRERAEATLHDEIARSAQLAGVLDTALQNMSQGLAMFGPDGRLITCNEKFTAVYRLSPASVIPGMQLHEIAEQCVRQGVFSGSDPDAYVEKRKRIAAKMMRDPTDRLAELNNGRTIRVISRPLPSGGWVMTSEDVTEQKRREDEITYLARHDILTGLANRSRFHARVAEVAAQHPRFNVLMLDLDRFKSVNDTMGHAAGDALLKEVARRLKAAVREVDDVARLGGDEFAIIQTAPRAGDDCAAEEYRSGAEVLADRILGAFSEPIDVGCGAVFAGISIGVALAPEHGSDGYELLKKADLALYAAKSAGRGSFRLFDPEMAAAANAQIALEAELRLALAREEFELHYQPIIEVGSGRPAIVEALVRWRHPARGLLAPGEFIRVAEETGLIVPLGEWILHRACQDAMAWPADLQVAVNLSTVQFRKSNLVDVVLFALADAGLPPERLELEVTESVLLGADPDYLATLRQLRNVGVTIALDDFGTGHSSLGYLNTFRFDRIKIDRSFVASIVDDPSSMAIVGAVCGLVRQLDMAATAEGVETEEQFAILRAAGVTFAQGFLFGRPVPAAALEFMAFAPGQDAAAADAAVGAA